jgi:hypothetical protein
MKVRALVVFSLAVVASLPLMAQTCSTTSYTNTLICTAPQLFGPAGLTMDNKHHNAHFADNSETQFRPLNQAIGQELSILPLGSAGAGTTFKIDSEGHALPTEDSLGPILTERASVVGRKTFILGVAYQYFSFDKIDGVKLSNFPAVLIHEGSADLTSLARTAFKNDYITTQNAVQLTLNQTVIYAVVGLTKHMDASIEIPIQAAHFRVSSSAHIVRTQPCEATVDPSTGGGDCLFSNGNDTNPPEADCGEFHFFGDTSSCSNVFKTVDAAFPYPGTANLIGEFPNTTQGPVRTGPPGTDASGVGDITLRGKYEVISGEKFVGSVGLAVRLSSGDAKNFLGTGAYGVTPFGVLTYASKLSPHVRVGYEWNSHSVLSGDPTLKGAETASLPPALLYSGGVDYRVTKRLTLAADLIGQRVLSANRVSLGAIPRLPETDGNTNPASESPVSVRSIVPVFSSSYSSDAVAVGGKIRLYRELVLIGNATIRVDDGGLRANVVPLVGLSWSK